MAKLSEDDRQKVISVMRQLMTANGMDAEDAEALAPEVIDEAIQRGDS
jgi:hypothetical protein